MKNTLLSAIFALFFVGAAFAAEPSALAQSKAAAQPAAAAGGDAALTKQGIESGMPADDKSSPFEAHGVSYQFVGLRLRYIVIPKFMMSLFASGGTSLGVPSIGAEFSLRKNGFENIFSLSYASYSMDPVQFKGKSDGEASWEIVDANIKALYLASDFMWSSEMSPKVSFLYGAGIGLGLIFGDIHRVQAYLAPGSTAGDSGTYLPCTQKGAPNAFYCGSDNDHYGNYTEPSWANGGSKPIIFPWLSFNTGLRFKPSHSFVMRLDLGWNLFNGPFFGIAGDYGI